MGAFFQAICVKIKIDAVNPLGMTCDRKSAQHDKKNKSGQYYRVCKIGRTMQFKGTTHADF